MVSREGRECKPIIVINIDTKDDPREAVIAGKQTLKLVKAVRVYVMLSHVYTISQPFMHPSIHNLMHPCFYSKKINHFFSILCPPALMR